MQIEDTSELTNPIGIDLSRPADTYNELVTVSNRQNRLQRVGWRVSSSKTQATRPTRQNSKNDENHVDLATI